MEGIGKRVLAILAVVLLVFYTDTFFKRQTITIWCFPQFLDNAPLVEEISKIEKQRGIDIELEWLPFEGGAYRIFTAQSVSAQLDIVLGSKRILAGAKRDIFIGNEYVLAEDNFSMAVNLDVLKRAGISLDEVENMTVAEFMSVCQKLVEKGIVPIELHTSGTAGDMGTLSLVQNISGKKLFDTAGGFDEDSLTQALETVGKLGLSGYITVGAGYTQDTVLKNFLDGKSAFMLMWSSAINSELKNPTNIARIAYPNDDVSGVMYFSEKVSFFALNPEDKLANSVAKDLAENGLVQNSLGYTSQPLGENSVTLDYFSPQVQKFRERFSTRLIDLVAGRRTPLQIVKDLKSSINTPQPE